MDDAAILAFCEAQGDRRVRGAFRLVGVLAGVAVGFVLSLAELEAYHEALPVIVPAPIVAFTLLGELAVSLRRFARARNPRIPRAKLLR